MLGCSVIKSIEWSHRPRLSNEGLTGEHLLGRVLTQSVYDFKREFGALLTESIHLVRFGDHGVAGCDISFRHDCSVVTRREIDCVKLVSANLAGGRAGSSCTEQNQQRIRQDSSQELGNREQDPD